MKHLLKQNFEIIIWNVLLSWTITQVKIPPEVTNLLSVSVNLKGKKQSMLDVRYVNNRLYKEKIKFDDWKCFENYLQANKGCLFQFDLKNGKTLIYFSHTKRILVSPVFLTVPPKILSLLFYHLACLQYLSYLLE